MFEAMFKDSLPAQPSRIQMKPPYTPVPRILQGISGKHSPPTPLLQLVLTAECIRRNFAAVSLRECRRPQEQKSQSFLSFRSRWQYLSYGKGPGVQNHVLHLILRKRIASNVYFNPCSQICFLDQPKPKLRSTFWTTVDHTVAEYGCLLAIGNAYFSI